MKGRATLLAAAAAFALAACGGARAPSVAKLGTTTRDGAATTSAAGNESASAPSQAELQLDALKYAQCMRTHGMPDYPDPPAPGSAPVGGRSFLGTGPNPSASSTYRRAATACKSYAVATLVTPAGGARVEAQQLRYARCMRAHGEPDFPDPSAGHGFTIPPSVDQNSSTFQAAQAACRSLLPGANGPPGISGS